MWSPSTDNGRNAGKVRHDEDSEIAIPILLKTAGLPEQRPTVVWSMNGDLEQQLQSTDSPCWLGIDRLVLD